jgi:endonuclease
MRLVVARCTVVYEGRLTATLPAHTRLLMVKADGCVAIHSDGGAYKPLNWMNAPNTVRETMADDGRSGEWVVANPKGETLTITLHEIVYDSAHDLGIDPGLQKEGVEAELQLLLSERTDVLAAGLTLIRREYPTEIGPVDLLCRDANGVTVAVEIKRRGEIDGVEQLTRYVEFLNRDPVLAPVRGMFVAQEIRPQAKVLASDRGLTWVEVDYDELRDRPSNVLRLF